MKKLLLSAIVCVSAVIMSGCGVIPMKGNTLAPVVLGHTVSDPVIDNSIRPIKRGESQSWGIILYSTGDASIGAAMKNGGITKLHHVDYAVKNILFLYNETTTIVYGE